MIKTETKLFDTFIIHLSKDLKVDSSRTKNDIEKTLSINGALVVSNLNRRVTHLICSEDDDGMTNDIAQELGVKLIPIKYFDDCLEYKKILDEFKYLFHDDDLEEAKKMKKNKKETKEIKQEKKGKKRTYSQFKDENEHENASEEMKKKKQKTGAKPKKISGDAIVDVNCKVLHKVTHVYIEDDVPWSAMLTQSNIKGDANVNKFYFLQLLEADTNDKWWLWTRWGRVGVVGQSSCKECPTLKDAKKEFEKKFKDKTKNSWSDGWAGFKKQAGLYFWIKSDDMDVDSGSEDEKKKVIKKDSDSDTEEPESKLPPETQQLIKLIANLEAMTKRVIEMSFDLKKMPLGKLSKEILEKASKVLSKIERELKKIPLNKEKLEDLSNDFYSLIPHACGMKKLPPIDSIKLVKKKYKMLDELGYVEISAKLLKIAKQYHNENPIDSQYKVLKATLNPLDKSGKAFKQILNYLKNTHAPTHNKYKLNIVNVFSVERESENDFEKNNKHIGNHKLLWHGSRVSNFLGIISQGLRIAPPEAPKTGYMFGKGIYFADVVSKSANYCHASKNNPRGCLLLCQVALGKCLDKTEAEYLTAEEVNDLGLQSTKGCGGSAPNKEEQDIGVPKGMTKCMIPLGALSATGVGKTDLLYNEYIVYSVSQVKIRYILEVEFLFK